MNIKTTRVITSLLYLFTLGQAIAATTEPLTIDPALINQERIAYWLKKRNQLTVAATEQQINAQVTRYIDNYRHKLSRQRLIMSPSASTSKASAQRAKQQRSTVNQYTITNANVLAILIDFPDLPYNANRLSRDDTEMYYADYSRQHYSDMLFNVDTFTGPNNESLITSRYYYQQESGGSFNFNGQVVGWYRAQHDASYYGGNDSDNNNADKKVHELIIEAVNAAVSRGGINLSQFDQNNDGVIDHLLVIHSSIGEEAGGGVLGESAIWSHRFSVGNWSVIGSPIKVDGYTIQPIDSAAGVVAHEFGHDLGLPDEYDIKNNDIGATVANWSIMAAGSWLGAVIGTEPNSFSPYARDYLQRNYGGKWANQLTINAKNLNQAGQQINLVAGVNHQGITNQIKVELPANSEPFIKPYSGRYQYYSGHKNQTTVKLSFSAQVANQADVSLSMKAQWDTEQDYDYVQVRANGVPLANQYTKLGIGDLAGVSNIITGQSAPNQWQTLNFDLSAYRDSSVNFEIIYVTDERVGGFGLVVDDISVSDSFTNNAESELLALNGFSHNDGNKSLEPQFYYIQLRSHSGLDKSLADISYSPGVLMWLADNNYEDNDVTKHPGHGFLAVIDADQQMISRANSLIQVSDAAFSLYQQIGAKGDVNTNNIAKFDDNNDYSSPSQPESGVKVVPWGITMTVTAQAQNSSTATINLTREISEILAKFSVLTDGLMANFSQESNSNVVITSYLWNFGDPASTANQSTEAAPSHVFSSAGRYEVTLKVTDADGNEDSITKQLIVSQALAIDIVRSASYLQANFSASVAGGLAPYQYQWDFGDQSTSKAGPSVTHTYASAGSYQVSLKITDSLGLVKSESFNYTVSAKVVVSPPTTETKKSGGGSLSFIGLLGLILLSIKRKSNG